MRTFVMPSRYFCSKFEKYCEVYDSLKQAMYAAFCDWESGAHLVACIIDDTGHRYDLQEMYNYWEERGWLKGQFKKGDVPDLELEAEYAYKKTRKQRKKATRA